MYYEDEDLLKGHTLTLIAVNIILPTVLFIFPSSTTYFWIMSILYGITALHLFASNVRHYVDFYPLGSLALFFHGVMGLMVWGFCNKEVQIRWPDIIECHSQLATGSLSRFLAFLCFFTLIHLFTLRLSD